MIFVTVGTELAFDRLVRTVDDWARENHRTDVFAQIGETGAEPSFIKFSRFLEPPEFAQCFASAHVIVSHAGMGTILSALNHGKPILVMPRLASLGEHRNEHQLATARRMHDLGAVSVAFDEAELRRQLAHIEELVARSEIGPFAEENLLFAIRDFIKEQPKPRRRKALADILGSLVQPRSWTQAA